VRPGDSASTIAQHLVHDGHRWPELVAANPSKPKEHDGNFASLRPGEILQLPATWRAPVAQHHMPIHLVHEAHP
jgi:hypothetical protein